MTALSHSRPRLGNWRGLRIALVGTSVAALAVGLWTGLLRLGLPLADGMPGLVEWHGALMISAFLGTLISLERAVAIGRWAYAAPCASAIGALALLIGAPWGAALAFLSAALALLGVSVSVAVRHMALFTLVPVIAAACWGTGTLAWMLGYSMRDVAGWWLAFLVLTIAAERLELSRLLAPPRINRLAFALTVALILVGAGRNEFAAGQAVFTGFGFLTLTAWLVRYDVVTRTIRRPGQPRFSAICMMGGYAWLAGAGMMLLVKAPDSATFSYDAAIHAVTIGFVLSMLFGHAPTILPAVTGVRVQINAHVYAPLALLHLSLLLRIVGDFTEWISLRATSGLLTVLSLAGYGGLLIATTYTKRAGRGG